MKKTIEVVAKKVDDAIAEGLKKLGVTIDEVDVHVLEQGGFFKKAKVELTVEVPDPKPEKKEERKSEVRLQEETVKEKKPAAPKAEPQKEERKPEPKKEESAQVKESAKKQDKQDKQPKPKKKFEEKQREQADVKPEHIAACEKFLSGLVAKMSIDGKVTVSENNGIEAVIETEDSSVIGYRGEVLDAMQYLTSLVLNGAGGKHIRFSLDALGYRARREETLKRLAQKTAEKCIKNNRKVALEPMNSAERRIIHAALGDNEKVITRSEGHEPNRRVAVLPRR